MIVGYLTQATIHYSIAAREWKDGGFKDSYAWHKRIWETFPNDGDAQRDFLSRLDDTGDGFRLLILSKSEPQKPDWCATNNWRTKTIDPSFFQHQNYQFSLLANPTVKKRSNAKGELLKNSRRVALVKREDLVNWLQRKSEQSGFSISTNDIKTVPRPKQIFVKKNKVGAHAATEFIGTLRVKEPEKFTQSVMAGIGPAKAFGFGLICLAPINTP